MFYLKGSIFIREEFVEIHRLKTIFTRMAIGSNNKDNQHLGITYKTMEDGFFESGVEFNKLFKGFGLVTFFRYGPNQLAKVEDNIAIKVSYFLDLGF